jgi:hypothetical protein
MDAAVFNTLQRIAAEDDDGCAAEILKAETNANSRALLAPGQPG